MIFLYELLVYIPYYWECFFLVWLMLRRCEKKQNYWRNLTLLLVLGTVWQTAVSALIFLNTPRFFAAFGVIKFFLSALPLYFFAFVYRIRMLRLTYTLALSMIFWRCSSVFAGIIVSFAPLDDVFFFERAITYLSFALTAAIVWFFFIRKATIEEVADQDGTTLILFVVSFMLFEILQVLVNNFFESRNCKLVLSILELSFLLFMLYQSVRVARRNRERMETIISAALLEKERRQFEQLKQNMDNMKTQVHDIKYILRAAKNLGVSAELTSKLEDVASMYESSFNTGNPALDTILSDAENKFRAKCIRFECFTESCDLSFIKNYDLYSLLGNAFDNAAEYLTGKEEQKRYTSFTLKRSGAFVFIEVSNYYDGDEKVYVGMKTSKPDKAMHGYGMKNMQRIVEKYDGEFSVRAEGGAFYVTVLIPIVKI